MDHHPMAMDNHHHTFARSLLLLLFISSSSSGSEVLIETVSQRLEQSSESAALVLMSSADVESFQSGFPRGFAVLDDATSAEDAIGGLRDQASWIIVVMASDQMTEGIAKAMAKFPKKTIIALDDSGGGIADRRDKLTSVGSHLGKVEVIHLGRIGMRNSVIKYLHLPCGGRLAITFNCVPNYLAFAQTAAAKSTRSGSPVRGPRRSSRLTCGGTEAGDSSQI